MNYIKTFEKFHTYDGPGRKIGFNVVEPTHKASISIDVISNIGNPKEEIEKILNKYDIPVSNLEVENDRRNKYNLKINFGIHSNYEMLSILKSIMLDLEKDDKINFEKPSLKINNDIVEPKTEYSYRNRRIGFKKEE